VTTPEEAEVGCDTNNLTVRLVHCSGAILKDRGVPETGLTKTTGDTFCLIDDIALLKEAVFVERFRGICRLPLFTNSLRPMHHH